MRRRGTFISVLYRARGAGESLHVSAAISSGLLCWARQGGPAARRGSWHPAGAGRPAGSGRISLLSLPQQCSAARQHRGVTRAGVQGGGGSSITAKLAHRGWWVACGHQAEQGPRDVHLHPQNGGLLVWAHQSSQWGAPPQCHASASGQLVLGTSCIEMRCAERNPRPSLSSETTFLAAPSAFRGNQEKSSPRSHTADPHLSAVSCV